MKSRKHRPYSLVVFSKETYYDSYKKQICNKKIGNLYYCRKNLRYLAEYCNYQYSDWLYFNVYENNCFILRIWRKNI